MPRCSCAGSSCSCQIQAGAGLALTGTGNTGAPFTLSLSSPSVAIVQSAAGILDLSQVDSGALVSVNLQANVTSVVLPAVAGASLDVVFWQGTAGRTVTWGPTLVRWGGGAAPVLSATLNYGDWFRLRAVSSTSWLGAIQAQAIR